MKLLNRIKWGSIGPIIISLISSTLYLWGSILWDNIGPGGGSDLLSIVIHPQNPNIVYLGGDIEGIWKTTDGGTTWRFINNNLARGPWTPDAYNIQQIKFDPTDPSYQTLYICTLVGLFKTTTGGNSWTLVFPDTFYSEADFVIVYSIAIDPDNPDMIFVGTAGRSVWQTSDGGITWDSLAVPMIDTAVVYAIYIDPTTPPGNRTVYIGTSDGVYKSSDNGNTWSDASTGLPHREVWNLKGVVSGGNSILYVTLVTHGTPGNPASFQGGIFKSTNGAVSWVDITSNLPKYQPIDSLFYFYQKFAVNPLNLDVIYIGTIYGFPDESLGAYEEWGVYKTSNGGVSWVKTDTIYVQGWMDSVFFDERHALVLDIAPSDTSVIYWGRDWMAKSTDAGATWQQIYTTPVGNAWKGNGLEMMMTEGMTFDPSDPNIIYVGYDDMGPFKSVDGGNSFRPLDSIMDPYDGYDAGKDIEIDPVNTNHVYMSRYDGVGSSYVTGFSVGKVWRSTDGGNTWQQASNGLPDGRPDLVLDPVSGSPGNRTLYCVSYGNGVYKTTNSGASWTAVNNGLGTDAQYVWTIAINPNNNQELYLGLNTLGSGGGLYRTTDGGANWTKLVNFPPYDVLNIEIDASNNYVYVGATDNYDWSQQGGLYRSTDGGNTWTQILAQPRVSDVEISSQNSDIIFAISQPWYSIWIDTLSPGVYRSMDGGVTWNSITGDIQHAYILFIKLHPANSNRLYAGTAGGGLWVTDSALVNVKEFSHRRNGNVFEFRNTIVKRNEIKFYVRRTGKFFFKLYTISGRKLFDEKIFVNTPGFNTLNLPSKISKGVYFISVFYEGKTVINKILKLK